MTAISKEDANLALLDAAMALDIEGIRTALKNGADVNTRETRESSRRLEDDSKIRTGATPLIYACWEGPDALECVNELLAAKADVNLLNNKISPIYAAAVGSADKENCQKDAKPLIDTLVAAGANPNQESINDWGFTPLNVTVGYESISLSAMKALLEHKANPNVYSYRGLTSPANSILTKSILEFGISDSDRLEAVKALVAAGAEVSPEGKAEDYSIMLAPHKKEFADKTVEGVKKIYAEAGKLPLTSEFKSPIGCAIHRGNYDIFKFLLDSEANIHEMVLLLRTE